MTSSGSSSSSSSSSRRLAALKDPLLTSRGRGGGAGLGGGAGEERVGLGVVGGGASLVGGGASGGAKKKESRFLKIIREQKNLDHNDEEIPMKYKPKDHHDNAMKVRNGGIIQYTVRRPDTWPKGNNLIKIRNVTLQQVRKLSQTSPTQ